MARLAEHKAVDVRFIECMPFEGNGWDRETMVGQEEILAGLRTEIPGLGIAEPGNAAQQEESGSFPPLPLGSETSRQWRVPGWKGTVGVVASMTRPFCGGCNRLRLTSEGQLKTCLFGSEQEEVGLLSAIRGGASPEDLAVLAALALGRKHRQLGGHSSPDAIGLAAESSKGVDSQDSEGNSASTSRPMILIGG